MDLHLFASDSRNFYSCFCDMLQAVSVTAGKLMDAIVVDTKHVAAECIR